MNHWKLFLALIPLAVFAAQATAGDIAGTVAARGKEESGGGGDKYASRKFKFVERVEYETLRDFVVSIEGPPPAGVPGATIPAVVTQKGAVFSPRILPVMVGTTVEWPNDDDIFHNVFSISETKEFDLGLYKNPEKRRVTFNRAGRVDVLCSIHTQMSAVVLVLENPFFAKSDEQGNYAIKGLPAGEYTVRAWHERLPGVRRKVTVPATGAVRLDFVLGPGGAQEPAGTPR
ncbi:MAG: carboxypeptidase regulatory-like domain-containing protein [Opitutaceae bacterium]